jgi:hypothetical protein
MFLRMVEKFKNFKPSWDVETELVLTPLRAFWLWNAAGVDLNQLKTTIVSNTSLCLTAEAARQIWWLTTTPSIPSGIRLVHFSIVRYWGNCSGTNQLHLNCRDNWIAHKISLLDSFWFDSEKLVKQASLVLANWLSKIVVGNSVSLIRWLLSNTNSANTVIQSN